MERIWLKHYPAGVPADINADQYPNLVTLLEQSFAKYAHRPAYTNMDKTLTFKQTDQLSSAFGAYLQKNLGLLPGEKIAIMMPNCLQYPIALFGALKAGLVVVNTNPLYTPREMEHQFNDAECKAIVIMENFAANLEKIIGKTGIKHIITTQLGDLLGFPKRNIVNFVVKNIKKMVPSFSLKGTIPFSQALAEGQKLELNRYYAQPDDVALLQYTGGTTGVSKGAMLTHRNLCANMEQVGTWLNASSLNEGEEFIVTALPLYHIFAFTVNCLCMVKFGGRNLLITNPRDIPAFLKELKKYPVTLFTGVNTLFNALLNHPDFGSIDFSRYKVCIGGGMAVQRPVAEKWKQVTKCTLSEGYGLTESSPVLTVHPLDGTGRIGTIGLPVPSTQVKIVSESGEEVPLGERGEIIASGPQIMKGYYRRPEDTAQVVKNGWLYTGDIGIMDPDGAVRIVDRKKDMILVSGFNVYPNEIEEVLASHAGVLEAAAVGVPDSKSTEAVKVFIVRRDPNLTAEQLEEHCRNNLTGYKVPKYIEFREELPKTNVGKILRRTLRDEELAKQSKS